MKVTKTQRLSALKKIATGKVTAGQIAEKYNVHPSTISKWKNGTEYEKTPKSTRVSKRNVAKKVTMLKSTKASFTKSSSEDRYGKIKNYLDDLKKTIDSLYKITSKA